jgi:hypothetical protein
MEIKKPASDINIQKLIACFNLASQLDDIGFLVIDYDQNIEHGFADTTTLDIYTRSGIILCITAWETFIENILSIEFENRMSSITTPDEIRHTTNSVAQARVNKKSKINSQHLLEWAGNGWKHLINESFKSEIQSLNTPSTENIRKIVLV